MDNSEIIRQIELALLAAGVIRCYHPTAEDCYRRETRYVDFGRNGKPIGFAQKPGTFGHTYVEITKGQVDQAVANLMRGGYKLWRIGFHPEWPGYFMANDCTTPFAEDYDIKQAACVWEP